MVGGTGERTCGGTETGSNRDSLVLAAAVGWDRCSARKGGHAQRHAPTPDASGRDCCRAGALFPTDHDDSLAFRFPNLVPARLAFPASPCTLPSIGNSPRGHEFGRCWMFTVLAAMLLSSPNLKSKGDLVVPSHAWERTGGDLAV
eukprot:668490-Rhodomonas_salina.4